MTALTEKEVLNRIYTIRGKRVMLDQDLAGLYGVEIRALNQAVKRNTNRFPMDFMFQLSKEEYDSLRSQIVILKGRGQHSKYLPYAFTEHGILMLSSVLRSERAAEVNIQIMRAFVQMREMLASTKGMLERLDRMEDRKMSSELSHFFEIF